MKEIGLFCGTFNPIHLGHLLIAECARDQFALSKVLFVTSLLPPHRSGGLLPGRDRHLMVQAAVDSNQHFEASDLELNRPGPSYTVDTVKQVIAQYGDVRVNLIIGGDNMPFLKEWHRAEELVSLCRLIVVPRLRYVGEASQPDLKSGVIKTINQMQADSNEDYGLKDAHIAVVDFPGIAISASTIRKRVAAGKSVLYMVPPEVNRIIGEKKFFHKTDPAEQMKVETK